MVLISNDIADALQAMCIYRDKDVVEKGVLRLKNSIDLGRLRVHSDQAMQGKLFVGFLSSILMAEINKKWLNMAGFQDIILRTKRYLPL